MTSSDLFDAGVATPADDSVQVALAASVVAPQEADESADRAVLRMQKSKALSQQFSDRAAEALARADLVTAIELYSEAIQLDPANQSAREGFRRVEAMIGDPLSISAEEFNDDSGRYAVKQAMVRARAEQANSRGDTAVASGDFDSAVEYYRQAETILRLDPLIATESLDERIVRAKLEEAILLRDEAERLEIEQTRAAAEEEVSRMEAAERDRLRNKLRTYYDNANRAFRAEKYGEAAQFANLILVADPGNETAQELLEISREAGHAKVDARLRRDYREEWLRTFDDLRTMDVPQERDPRLRPRAVGRKSASVSPSRSSRSSSPRIPNKLRCAASSSRRSSPRASATRTAPRPSRVSLSSSRPRAASTSRSVRQSSTKLGEDEVAVELDLSERSVLLILDTIALLTEGMSWKIEDGVVLFVTDAEMTGGQVYATYSRRRPRHPHPRLRGARHQRRAVGRPSASGRGPSRARGKRHRDGRPRGAHPEQHRPGELAERPGQLDPRDRDRHTRRQPDPPRCSDRSSPSSTVCVSRPASSWTSRRAS